jgi:regulator of protease activity HflC (stomatin/prohibitin superfamily)
MFQSILDKPGKTVSIIAGAVFTALVALNSFTIVQEGTVKVQNLFGEVNKTEVLTAGPHLVNPLKSFDTFSVRNDKYEVNALNIPTQDRFNSTANVTVLYNIDGSLAPIIKTDYGTSDQYIDKTMRQHLRSIIRDEGRKLLDSRSLAMSDNVSTMQENTRKRLTEALTGTGITVNDVLIQDIEFDSRISAQILATQQRIQAEEKRKSEERIADTNARIAKAEALGAGNRKREEADAAAYSLDIQAKAEKQAAIDRATGEAEAIALTSTAQAEANRKLNLSLTPNILRKQELDNEAILFGKSVGNVPTTIIGDTDLRAIGIPVATSTN